MDHQREKYGIEGEGFVWSHATMDSLEAMDHIDRAFLEIKESIWLPQWSFDFWIIPYLLGKGISLAQFKQFMSEAHNLLTLEIASLPEEQKRFRQHRHLENMVTAAKDWPQSSTAALAPVEAQHAISA